MSNERQEEVADTRNPAEEERAGALSPDRGKPPRRVEQDGRVDGRDVPPAPSHKRSSESPWMGGG